MPLKAKGEFVQVHKNMQSAFSTSGQPVKRGTMAHEHELYMLLTDTAAQARDAAGLRKYTPQLEALAVRDNHRLYQAIAQRAWGVAGRLQGDYEKSEQHLQTALKIFRDYGARWQIGRTLFEIAELMIARGELEPSKGLLSEALQLFEQVQARPEIARVRDLFSGYSPEKIINLDEL